MDSAADFDGIDAALSFWQEEATINVGQNSLPKRQDARLACLFSGIS
jgi:hypothetical protein